MNANELRIGNLIKVKKEVLKEIDDIPIKHWLRGKILIESIKIERNTTNIYIEESTTPIEFVISSKAFVNEVNIEKFEPIPLTKEWLMKAGFKDNSLVFTEYGNELDYRAKSKEMLIWGSDGSTDGHNIRVKCEYVHQLQNLYFTLTGNELPL